MSDQPSDQAEDRAAEAGLGDDATMAELAALLGSPVLPADERTAVLDLTRVVAHTVQRRFGPLAAYSLGLAAGAGGAAGTEDRTAALREAITRLEDRAGGDASGEA